MGTKEKNKKKPARKTCRNANKGTTQNKNHTEKGTSENKDNLAQRKGKQKGKRKKQLEYSTESKTLISMVNGMRTLNFSSLNPDSMRDKETHQEIINGLNGNKIHLAAIQETHIARDCNYMMGNNRVITTAAEKSETT